MPFPYAAAALTAAPYVIQGAAGLASWLSSDKSNQEYFHGSPAKTQQLPVYNPQQQQLQGSIIDQINNALRGGQLPYENDLVNQYTRDIVPRLTAQYGRGSSALQQALQMAGKDLVNDMSGQRQQFIQGLLPYAFNQSYENAITPGTTGELPGIISNLSNTAAGQISNYQEGSQQDLIKQLIEQLRNQNTQGASSVASQQNRFNPEQRNILDQYGAMKVLGGSPTRQNPNQMAVPSGRLKDIFNYMNIANQANMGSAYNYKPNPLSPLGYGAV